MKKLFLAFAAALLVSAGICNSASAQEWPQRTIRIIVSSDRAPAPISSAAFWRTRCKANSASR
jgi:hypothetical protein